jgi:tripartite-type tricarboxylate transporter receptor subunit TctC
MASLIEANKLDMVRVPYKGEAQAVVDMVGGRVPLMFVTPAVLPQLLKEKFRLIAVLLPERTRAFPNVPTMAEAGQPLVNIRPWGGLLGPAKMPKDLVDRISKDFNVIMRKPDVVEQYDKLGLLPTPSSPEVLGAQVKEQLGIWTRTMRAAGIELE